MKTFFAHCHTTAFAMISFAIAWIGNIPCAEAAITFTPGNYYSSNYFSRDIRQYDASGAVRGTFTVPEALGSEVRGIAFGADGLLYATMARDSSFAVCVFDAAGNLRQTYPYTTGDTYIRGNLSYGKIAVSGSHIFVAGGGQITRFDIGNPSSGVSIYQNNQLYDVEILPDGNLLAAWAYGVANISTSGSILRNIGSGFTDVRGVEYDPVTNNLFVSMLGNSSAFFQVMRLDGTSGQMEESFTLNYADDLFLTASGQLLIGSRTLSPGIYTQDLDSTGIQLGNESRMFVTQFNYIPEPGGTFHVFLSLAMLLSRRSKTPRLVSK